MLTRSPQEADAVAGEAASADATGISTTTLASAGEADEEASGAKEISDGAGDLTATEISAGEAAARIRTRPRSATEEAAFSKASVRRNSKNLTLL